MKLLRFKDKSNEQTRVGAIKDKNIVDQLQKLNDLYKSGALTKEEFEKAKKKILN